MNLFTLSDGEQAALGGLLAMQARGSVLLFRAVALGICGDGVAVTTPDSL